MKQKLSQIAEHTWLTKTTVALLGTCSLIGWSAVLSSFDFFASRFPKSDYPDPTFYFPIPLKVGSFIWTFGMGYLIKKLSLKVRICGFIAVQAVLMILLPVLALYMQNDTGYILIVILCFLIGSTACVIQNSNLALVATFDKLSLKIYWIFTSITGFLMNIGRAIILAIFGDSEEGVNTGIYIYYVMADIIMLVTIVCLLKFLKSQFYLDMEEMRKYQVEYPEKSENETLPQSTLNLNLSSSDSQSQNVEEPMLPKEQTYFQKVKICFKKVVFISLAIFMTFIIQYMLFPGVAVFQKTYHLISSYAWSVVTMQIIYSCGDLFGKFLSGLSFYNLTFLYILSFCRYIFFFTFLMIAHDKDSSFFQSDYLAFINIFLLSTTNGLLTGGFMLIGPTKGSNKEERSIISMIQGFFLTFGIAIGTFLALTLNR